MGEAVAIISVAASAMVGAGGLIAAAWGSSRERSWRSREERATELRSVLEDAAGQLANLTVLTDEAHDEARRGPVERGHRLALRQVQQRLAVEANRIGIRTGPEAPEYLTFAECFRRKSAVVTILEEAVDRGLDREQHRAYGSAWDIALEAEQGFLRAAADVLSVPRSRAPLWCPRRLRG